MAHVRKGQLTAAKEWWVHLRKTKRDFWKAERKAARFDAVARWHADERVAVTHDYDERCVTEL